MGASPFGFQMTDAELSPTPKNRVFSQTQTKNPRTPTGTDPAPPGNVYAGVNKTTDLETRHYKFSEPEKATRDLPDSPRSTRPMRKNFSRRFLRSASADFTNFGATPRIIS